MTAPAGQYTTEAALVAQYNAQARQVRATLAALLGRLWGSLRGDYRAVNEARFVAQAVPASQGAQRAMSALTAAYLARMVAAGTGTAPRPPVVPQRAVTGEALRGVDPAVVYRRPLEQARYALSRGKSPAQAGQVGLRRAQSLAATDTQLAKTHTARQVMAADGRVVGYRRVLTGAENCGLCVVASTLRYHVKDLMPIHPGCDCACSPVIGHRDPGLTINTAQVAEGAQAVGETRGGVKVYQPGDTLDLGDLLEPVHAAIEDRFGTSYRDAREIDYRKVITVHRHSEIGPVLSVTGHRFTKKQIESGDLSAKPHTLGRKRG